jgi:hypothetical protein
MNRIHRIRFVQLRAARKVPLRTAGDAAASSRWTGRELPCPGIPPEPASRAVLVAGDPVRGLRIAVRPAATGMLAIAGGNLTKPVPKIRSASPVFRPVFWHRLSQPRPVKLRLRYPATSAGLVFFLAPDAEGR